MADTLYDLINLDYARQHIPTSQDTDEPTISTLVTAASYAIQRYCKRYFSALSYDELYNGNGDRRLLLRSYPLQGIASVRYRPVTVLKIQNSQNNANTPIARVQVGPGGITLTWVVSGVSHTDTSLTWSSYATVVAIENALNANGALAAAGWSATGTGYDQWPSADIYCPNGLSGASAIFLPQTQGALTAAGQNAELKMHTYELAGYQLDPQRGWLLRAIPYTDPELMHPEDLIFPIGINNFRVQYTAGFSTIPDDVQEACAELVATWFSQLGKPMTLKSEEASGSYVYQAENSQAQLPARIRAMLRTWRAHPVSTNRS